MVKAILEQLKIALIVRK